MKRLLVLVAVAAGAVGLYATTAGGTQQAVTPAQFAALKKQVATLQKNVTGLEKDVTGLKTVVANCFGPIGIASFGDPGKVGYHYKQPDGTEIITTALDVVGSGETPQYLMVTLNPSCVQGAHLAFHTAIPRGSAHLRH